MMTLIIASMLFNPVAVSGCDYSKDFFEVGGILPTYTVMKKEIDINSIKFHISSKNKGSIEIYEQACSHISSDFKIMARSKKNLEQLILQSEKILSPYISEKPGWLSKFISEEKTSFKSIYFYDLRVQREYLEKEFSLRFVLSGAP